MKAKLVVQLDNANHSTTVTQYYENRYGRKSLTERLRDLIPRRGINPPNNHRLLNGTIRRRGFARW